MRKYLLTIAIIIFCGNIFPAYATETLDLNRAIKNYNEGHYEEALSTLTRLYYKKNDSLTACYVGMTAKQMGFTRQAAFYLDKSIKLPGAPPQAYIELADILIQAGNLDRAKKIIQEGQNKGNSSAKLDFLKGVLSAKEGDYTSAINAFNAAKKQDKTLESAADLQIATAQIASGKYNDAKSALHRVIIEDPNSDLSAYARQYQEAVKLGINHERQFRFTLGGKYLFDSNVILKPSDSSVAQGITGGKDSALVSTLVVDWTPEIRDKDWFLSGQDSLYSSAYFKQHTYDVLSNSVSLLGGRNFSWGSASVNLGYTHAWVDGRQYLSMPTATGMVRIPILDSLFWDLGLGYVVKNYLQPPAAAVEDRDARVVSHTIGIGWLPFKGRMFIYGKYEADSEDTDGGNWANLGYHYTLSSSYMITERLKAQAYYDFFEQKFRNVHTLFGIQRHDKTSTEGVSLAWNLRGLEKTAFKNMSLIAEYAHTQDKSNIKPSVYSYKRDLLSTGVEYRF